MAKHILLAVLLLLSPLLAQGQVRKTFNDLDGSDWQEFSDVVRDAYITGYVSAMVQAEAFATVCEVAASTAKIGADSPAADVARVCIGERHEFHFAEVAGVAQYRESMNAFYKDFRNLKVPLPKAIGLVRDQISGRPTEDIEKELVMWRQCHADGAKCDSPGLPKQATPK